ncbi:DUF3211 domain-containing protein [Acidianus sp. HS-5]|uniref:DUF3211 domain-containing protein n=1 Tax=Acidianus sp. HS-5 TaxID=2886040 RepID=UPI001F34ABF7|nr:DUF3211 domain-containing protein [Acidianus sp. HS-5]BDC18457.1 hypothetical protein HS5_13470 [Acidianus sp. HS-5]
MRISVEIETKHESNALLVVLSDPSFVLPNLFPPIKEVKANDGKYTCKGKFLGMPFDLVGNYYSSDEGRVKYAFTINRGGTGNLDFLIEEHKVILTFDYDGWSEKISKLFLSRWINEFKNNFEEKVRLKRIENKI